MNEITKQLMCVCMRNGVQLWIEKERVERLQELLNNTSGNRFIDFDGQTINTADVVGIFTAESMADLTRRKNGQWQCDYGKWHQKGDQRDHHRCTVDAKKSKPPMYAKPYKDDDDPRF